LESTHGYAAAKVCVFVGHAQARHFHLLENRAGVRNKSATGLGKAGAQGGQTASRRDLPRVQDLL
jgi:hypothetical protein